MGLGFYFLTNPSQSEWQKQNSDAMEAFEKGKVKKAYQEINQAVQTAQKDSKIKTKSLVQIRKNRLKIALELGDGKTAEKDIHFIFENYQKSPDTDPSKWLEYHVLAGLFAFDFKKYSKAIEHYQIANNGLQKKWGVGHKKVIQNLFRLANAYLANNNLPAAKKISAYLQDLLPEIVRSNHEHFIYLARLDSDIALKNQNLNLALAYLQKAEKITQENTELKADLIAQVYNDLSLIYLLNKNQRQAHAYFQKAYGLIEKNQENFPKLWQTLKENQLYWQKISSK